MTTLRARAHRVWARHRTLFWIIHSVWALATGVVVLFLAHERYGFLPWVVGFMVLTWASTLFFGRRTAEDAAEVGVADDRAVEDVTESEAGERPETAADDAADEVPSGPGILEEVTSYLTRIMYQETLFFLLPFYAYSTVWGSPNVFFLALLGALAVVSCLDLVFDRWLRASPVFGLVFFASVAFAGVNLVLPMFWRLPPRLGTPVAAGVAVVAAAVLAWRTTRGLAPRLRLALAGAAFLAVVTAVPSLVPPVPVRLQSAVFSTAIERSTLTPADSLGGSVAAGDLPRGLVVLARVFAPAALPASVSLEWRRDGGTVRTSQEIEVTAHEAGFRVWDALRPEGPRLPPGSYEVIFRTWGERVFGKASIRVGEGADASGGGPPTGSAGEPDSGPRLAEGGTMGRP